MASNGAHGKGESVTGAGQEKINLDIITLTRFLTEEQSKHKEATGDFTSAKPFPPRGHTDTLPDSSAMPSNSPSSPLPTTSAVPLSST
jgi:hypothetical protein